MLLIFLACVLGPIALFCLFLPIFIAKKTNNPEYKTIVIANLLLPAIIFFGPFLLVGAWFMLLIMSAKK